MKQQANDGDRWKVIPILEELKAKARAAGLWNMFMPPLVRPRRTSTTPSSSKASS